MKKIIFLDRITILLSGFLIYYFESGATAQTFIILGGFKWMGKYAELNQEEIDRIIEMAWEDRTSFDAIERQFGISDSQVISIMRIELKPSSFKMWRKRVQGRSTKHAAKFHEDFSRFKSNLQKGITGNKISKRT